MVNYLLTINYSVGVKILTGTIPPSQELRPDDENRLWPNDSNVQNYENIFESSTFPQKLFQT